MKYAELKAIRANHETLMDHLNDPAGLWKHIEYYWERPDAMRADADKGHWVAKLVRYGVQAGLMHGNSILPPDRRLLQELKRQKEREQAAQYNETVHEIEKVQQEIDRMRALHEAASQKKTPAWKFWNRSA